MEPIKQSRPKRIPRNAADFHPVPLEHPGGLQSSSLNFSEPNPNPAALLAEQNVRRKVRGVLVGSAVWILEPNDITWLFTHGFYGKGCFSRSAPCFQEMRETMATISIPQYGDRGTEMEEDRGAEEEEDGGRERGFSSPASKRFKGDPEEGYEDHVASLEQVMMLAEEVAEDGGGGAGRRRTTGWSPSEPPREHLQLCLEESFFLSLAFGCLEVVSAAQPVVPMTTEQLWRKSNSLKENFTASYAAYHHFRAKGWVTKPGTKYGVDWILYRRGPAFFHSDYGVIVRAESAAASAAEGGNKQGHERELSWSLLSNLVRVAGQVAKELVICYVVFPADEEAPLHTLPVCDLLKRLQVHEQVIRRWLPEKERE